jgi:CDP-glucose 4,6-dehydratase
LSLATNATKTTIGFGAIEKMEPMGGRDPYSSSKGCAKLVVSAFRQSYFLASGSEQPSVLVGAEGLEM